MPINNNCNFENKNCGNSSNVCSIYFQCSENIFLNSSYFTSRKMFHNYCFLWEGFA